MSTTKNARQLPPWHKEPLYRLVHATLEVAGCLSVIVNIRKCNADHWRYVVLFDIYYALIVALSTLLLFADWHSTLRVGAAYYLIFDIVMTVIFGAWKSLEQRRWLIKSPSRAMYAIAIYYYVVILSFAAVWHDSHALVRSGLPVTEKIDALYFTVVTLATVGYGDIAPSASHYGVGILHIVVGWLLFLFTLPVVLSVAAGNLSQMLKPDQDEAA